LTNALKDNPPTGPQQAAVDTAGASAFSHTFWWAAVLVTLTLASAYFLPRKHEESHLLDDEGAEGAPPVLVH
jgi:hypothetical protein